MFSGINKLYTNTSFAKKMLQSSLGLVRNVTHRPRSDTPCFTSLRFIQFVRNNDGRVRLGVVSNRGNCFVDLSGQCATVNSMNNFIQNNFCTGDLLMKIKLLKSEVISDKIKLLSPITRPGKIICFDYRKKTFDECDVFVTNKLSNSLTGPTDDINLDPCVKNVEITADLAIIIGCGCTFESYNVMDMVFGYSIAHNVTAIEEDSMNNILKKNLLIRSSMKSFCPLGPAIVHKSLITDPQNLWITSSVNGFQLFCGNTNSLDYKIEEIIGVILKYLVLCAGDVILIKVPLDDIDSKCVPHTLKPGDVIETEMQDIGKLKNKIVVDINDCESKKFDNF